MEFMKAIGTANEIEWMKEALQNNCDQCPYMKECNESAKQDNLQHGEIQYSCRDFLETAIKFIVENGK